MVLAIIVFMLIGSVVTFAGSIISITKSKSAAAGGYFLATIGLIGGVFLIIRGLFF
jgi:hypothetical protein